MLKYLRSEILMYELLGEPRGQNAHAVCMRLHNKCDILFASEFWHRSELVAQKSSLSLARSLWLIPVNSLISLLQWCYNVFSSGAAPPLGFHRRCKIVTWTIGKITTFTLHIKTVILT